MRGDSVWGGNDGGVSPAQPSRDAGAASSAVLSDSQFSSPSDERSSREGQLLTSAFKPPPGSASAAVQGGGTGSQEGKDPAGTLRERAIEAGKQQHERASSPACVSVGGPTSETGDEEKPPQGSASQMNATGVSTNVWGSSCSALGNKHMQTVKGTLSGGGLSPMARGVRTKVSGDQVQLSKGFKSSSESRLPHSRCGSSYYLSVRDLVACDGEGVEFLSLSSLAKVDRPLLFLASLMFLPLTSALEALSADPQMPWHMEEDIFR